MTRALLLLAVLAGCDSVVGSDRDWPALGRYAFWVDTPQGHLPTGGYEGYLFITNSNQNGIAGYWEVPEMDTSVGNGGRVGPNGTYQLLLNGDATMMIYVGGSGTNLTCSGIYVATPDEIAVPCTLQHAP